MTTVKVDYSKKRLLDRIAEEAGIEDVQSHDRDRIMTVFMEKLEQESGGLIRLGANCGIPPAWGARVFERGRPSRAYQSINRAFVATVDEFKAELAKKKTFHFITRVTTKVMAATPEEAAWVFRGGKADVIDGHVSEVRCTETDETWDIKDIDEFWNEIQD